VSELLRDARAAYASCSSYYDQGEVRARIAYTFEGVPQRHTTRLLFHTWFVRPDSFRFEFKQCAEGPVEEWQSYVAWGRHGRVRSWWSLRPSVESHATVLDALAGPTGVSHGSARTVPFLLLSDRTATWVFPANEDSTPVGFELLAEADCYLVRVSSRRIEQGDDVPSGSPTTYWIARDSLMIRRYRQDQSFTVESLRELRERSLRRSESNPPLQARLQEAFDSRAPLPFDCETTVEYRPDRDATIHESVFEVQVPR